MSDTPRTPPPRRDDFQRDSKAQAAHRRALLDHQNERPRNLPTKASLHTRRKRLDIAKWVLPCVAILMLGSIAVWPEVARWVNVNQAVLKEMEEMRVQNGTLEDAVYRGLDNRNRPYMITAKFANQRDLNRIDLVDPVAELHLTSGGWAQIRADSGVYMQHEQTLNLRGHVVLYRDDGTLMNSPTADLDLHAGIIASSDWAHAEGPFGKLDAQGYFLDQHAGLLEFTGPERIVRNNDQNDTLPTRRKDETSSP
ncbi:MAG: LPS export ABC transporter periplasmic protein LptC [Acetobacteraceae bacterium]